MKNGFGGPSNNIRRITNASMNKDKRGAAFYYSFNSVCLGKSLFFLIAGFIAGSVLKFSSTNDEIDVSGGSGQQKRVFAHKSDVHSSGFGGINNIAQPSGAKAYSNGQGVAHISDEELIPYYVTSGREEIPSSTTTTNQEVPSLGRPNLINAFGHYLHDEFRSPYASHLYDLPREKLEEEQKRFIEKMKATRDEWGAWTDIIKKLPKNNPLFNTKKNQQELPNFKSVPLRDLPNDKFPSESWQMNPMYVSTFMDEAKALIERVTEGIYAEYGFPIHKKGTAAELIEEVRSKFAIGTEPGHIPEGKRPSLRNNVAYLTPSGMDGLVRKLLHSLITNDDFYAVLSGHSAAAGHGNNFHQSKILKGMHYILEPVFDKLGMRLISRNLSMGGVGTLQFSMAGKSLLGETDFLIWDSGMTEGGKTPDFFNKQAIFSGARMPVLFTYKLFDLISGTNNTAWVGGINMDSFYKHNLIFPPSVDEVQAEKVPYAARYMNIATAENQKLGADKKYNSICWEDRTDFKADVPQDPHPGSQVGWHPGWRAHQFEGRIYALIILEGLKRAMELWERGIETDGFPLSEKYWHVTEAYQTQRETYRSHILKQQEAGEKSACEEVFYFLPRVCGGIGMSGYGMWTPRNMANPDLVVDIIQPAPNGYKPQFGDGDKMLQYDTFDLLPHVQQIPDGEVDVHAIAVATTNSPPADEDNSNSNDNNGGTNNTTETRRMLRKISQIAIHHGSQQQQLKEELETRNSENDRLLSSRSHNDDYVVLASKETTPIATATIGKTTTMNKNEQEREEEMSVYYDITNTTDRINDESLIPRHRELQNDILQKELIISAPKAEDKGEEIIPGRGWEVLHSTTKYSLASSYSDGSTVSIPNSRGPGAKCLAYGHNDGHYAVSGNSLSGWLVMKIPKIKEGIILARMEWWCQPKMGITKDWTTVNDGETTDTTPIFNVTTTPAGDAHRELLQQHQQHQAYDSHNHENYDFNDNADDDDHHRELGKPQIRNLVPNDLYMDVAINQRIVYTYTAETWRAFAAEPSKNCAVWPLLNDAEFRSKHSNGNENWQGEEMEVAIRFRSESKPQQGFCVSHLFYA